MPSVAPTPHAGGSHAPGRDTFLDTIRTVALLRVMLWHTLGLPVLTYIVAAVPTMVFVTGSLLAKSLDRRPWRTVLFERARRILLPLWAFGTVAFVAMSVAFAVDPSPHTAIRWRSIVFWILPLGDPQGSAWEGGWMSQPLWYVRAMFWLLLLSPVLRAGHRRLGARMLVVPGAALVVLEVLQRRSVVIDAAPELLWQLGDVAMYSLFLVAGFAHRDGRFDRLGASGWLRGAAVAAVAATGWILTQPVPLGVVNNSHPAHLLVGATWLCLLFAARRPIEAAARRRSIRTFVDTIAQRTMSIYLWHATAIIVTYQLLGPHHSLPTLVFQAAMVAGTVAVTSCLVLGTGWIEDIAARRAPRFWPLDAGERRDAGAKVRVRRRAGRPALHRVVGAQALAGVVVLALAASTAGVAQDAPAGTDAIGAARDRRPPVPSQGPPRPVFEATPDKPDAIVAAAVEGARRRVVTDTPEVDAVTSSAFQGALDDWRTRWSVPGAIVSVALPGVGGWTGASGLDKDLAVVTPSDRFDVASVTKSFTGALVFQLATEGRIDLDALVPPLDRVPAFPHSAGITVRDLLGHRSGLVPYRDTAAFVTDPAITSDPALVLDAAVRARLQFTPGEKSLYSSTNFLVLGFLIEQVTGQSYDDLLTTRLLEPLGLDRVTHLPPALQAPNFSTAGIVTDVSSLVSWALALYRDGRVVDDASLAQMYRIDPTSSLGPSVYGYCPCTVDPAGTPRWRWIGHSSGDTQMSYSATDDVAVVIHLTDSLWSEGRQTAVAELLELLRVRILELSPPATFPGFVDNTTGG